MLNKILCKNNRDEKISSELKQEPTLFFLAKEILKILKSLGKTLKNQATLPTQHFIQMLSCPKYSAGCF